MPVRKGESKKTCIKWAMLQDRKKLLLKKKPKKIR